MQLYLTLVTYTPEETMEALRNAGDIALRGPSGGS